MLGGELYLLRNDHYALALSESIEDLRQHDRSRTRDNKRVIVADLAKSFDEVIIWMTLKVIPQPPGRPVRSLRIDIPRID